MAAVPTNNMSLWRLLITVFFLITICSSVPASSTPRESAPPGKFFFVNDEPLVLELNEDDGDWTIETQADRILFLSFPDTESSQALKSSLTIYDGLSHVNPLLLFPAEMKDSVDEKKIFQQKFYSTRNVVSIRFHRSHASLLKTSVKYQLKIQKAVACPVSLGGESSCGRIVNEVSCYCATFTKRNWVNTRTFCLNNKMTFLRVDSYEEDFAVYRTWAAGGIFLWIGASDTSNEGYWIWDNGGRPMYPGYANWAPRQPDDGSDNEDCLQYMDASFAWNDDQCENLFGGICEAQP